MFIRILCLFFPFVFISSAAAQNNLSSEQLFAKYKPAVVKINVYLQGVKMGTGSGFFVSQDGVIVTNKHVIGNGFDGQFKVEVITSDAKVFTDYSVGKCSDKRNVDLCVIKINHTPVSWFVPRTMEYSIGQTVFTIGHPKGYEYTFSQGLLSGVRKLGSDNRETDPELAIENIQINAPISPGNSGGPVLNGKGELIGVVTWFRSETDSRELNFGVSSNEVVQFLTKTLKYLPLSQYREEVKKEDRAAVQMIKAKFYEPMLAEFKQGKYDRLRNDWTPVTLTFGNDKFTTYIPKFFGKCRVVNNSFACRDLIEGTGSVIFQFLPGKDPKAELRSLKGTFGKPQALSLTENLIKSGRWEEVSKKLTEKQKKFLFSYQSKPIGCDEFKDSIFPGFRNTTYCTFSLFNDYEADAASFITMRAYDHLPYIIRVAGWTGRSSLAGIYFHAAEIAVQLMKQTAGTL